MATNARDILPAFATHPGSVLGCELEERGIKQKDFAQLIGIHASNLNEIIKGKRHITPAIAIKLEDALGVPYQLWMELQSRYHYVVMRGQTIPRVGAEPADEPLEHLQHSGLSLS